jgi:hypothetical protein
MTRSRWFPIALVGVVAILSIAFLLSTEERAKMFCRQVQKGELSAQVEARARQFGFEIFRLEAGDGVLLAKPPGSFTIGYVHCEVRYAGGRVRSTAYFSD